MTHTNYMLNATASLYTHDMIMIFYTVVRQKLRFQHTKIVNSTVSPSCHFGMRNQCLAAGWQTWSATVGNVKISVSECPSYCCIRMQFGCLFYSLSLANCVSVMTKLLRLYKFTISCTCKRACRRCHAIPRFAASSPHCRDHVSLSLH